MLTSVFTAQGLVEIAYLRILDMGIYSKGFGLETPFRCFFSSIVLYFAALQSEIIGSIILSIG